MLKKLFESTLIIGSSYIFVMAIDMVRVKIFAVLLGPEGVGTLSILNQFHVVATTITSLGLGTGIVKYVATFENEGDRNSVQRLVENAFQVGLIAASSAFVLCFLFSSHLSRWILGDSKHSLYIFIYSVSLPLAIYPTVAVNFLVGLKKIRILAKINIYRSIISLSLIVPIVNYYRLSGAVFAVLVVTLVHLIFAYYFLKKEKRTIHIFKLHSFELTILKKLLPYGAVSLIAGASYYFSHLLLKMIIVHNLGIEMNGIYQPIWALTMTYPMLILSSMSAYSYPRICELKSDKEIVDELNGILRITTLLVVPIMFLLIVSRKAIIEILYSSNFLLATEYMPVQILGDYFRVLVWSIGMFLLPTKRLKASIWLSILHDVLLLVFAIMLVGSSGLHGITAAFSLCYFFTLIIYYFYSKRQIGFRLWDKNKKLLLLSTIALSAIILVEKLFSFYFYVVMIFLIIFFWSVQSVSKDEIFRLKEYISDRLFSFSTFINGRR